MNYSFLVNPVMILSEIACLTFFATIVQALLTTAPYWLILLVYCCVRKVILGTFTGSLPVVYYTRAIGHA